MKLCAESFCVLLYKVDNKRFINLIFWAKSMTFSFWCELRLALWRIFHAVVFVSAHLLCCLIISLREIVRFFLRVSRNISSILKLVSCINFLSSRIPFLRSVLVMKISQLMSSDDVFYIVWMIFLLRCLNFPNQFFWLLESYISQHRSSYSLFQNSVRLSHKSGRL